MVQIFGPKVSVDREMESLNSKIKKNIFSGRDRDAIYPMIDYTNKFNFAIQFNLVLIFGVQTAVFLSLYIISTIKHTICNKLMQENLECNKKQN